MTDVAHVFDFDFDSAIGRPGRFGRNGTSETSEVCPSFRVLKGFHRQWEKKLVVFMAGNASRVCYRTVTSRERYGVGSHRDIASFCCYDACEAQPD